MAQFAPFVLPPGVAFRLTEKGLHLSYDGDIDLQETPETGFALVEAGGDLEVRLSRITGSLRAGGTMRVRGDISGGRIHARHVVLGRQRIDCKAITATESITIGAAHITCDAIIAPVIHLDPKAFGRVTIIESRNERGATKIKGGFSVADYNDMFGNADEFLAARGLSRLGPSSEAPRPAPAHSDPTEATHPGARSGSRSVPPRTAPQPEPTTAPVLPIDEFDEDTRIVPPRTEPPATPRIASRTTPRPAPLASDRGPYVTSAPPQGYTPPVSLPPGHPPSAPPPPRRRVDEEEDDPSLSVSFGNMEPIGSERSDPGIDAELQQQLADALGRIVACYDGGELPPAVQQLRSLVEKRDYQTLRDDITDVWNGLLGFHQQRGIRPHHQVTHAFNLIHGLVQA